MKKNPFSTFTKLNNTLKKVGLSLTKSATYRHLHESIHRLFTSRCEPQVALKDRKARLDYTCPDLEESTAFRTTEGRKTHKQAATEEGCSKGLAKHPKGGNSAFDDVDRGHTSGSHWMIALKWKWVCGNRSSLVRKDEEGTQLTHDISCITFII